MSNARHDTLTANELEQAIAENHRQLFSLNAISLGGRAVRGNDIEWTYINDKEASAVMFPSLTEENVRQELNFLMESYRQYTPASAGYWSLLPKKPANIGLYLLARGWQTGWQPCWMALDTLTDQFDNTLPEGYRITEENDVDASMVKDLPYAEDNAYFSSTLIKQYPGKARRIVAWHNETIIGQCCLFFSEAPANVVGLYNMGVIPQQRKKGIGKALLHTAALVAQKKGIPYVTLNANHIGRPLYQKVGFKLIGYGTTWWLMNKNYLRQLPVEIQLAEAIGLGNINALDQLIPSVPKEILAQSMCNDMRWIEFAIYQGQEASVTWLMNNGAALTALDAWVLGWKEKATTLLRNDPEEINRRYFDWRGTLLHVAAEKNDLALLQFALQYNPDLTIKDHHHNGTPLDWAVFFKRDEMVRLLEQAE
ncbi:GNAT family N-acetyltransferase [Terrimonas sp. NA20]|uniref:GNAT family N-acetyltransferase n=1 Tax=Terrimonas ginsenosidimutans TaxID=2908004 RepID=A0ABS9KPI5_9BACT|nr:GNAT family N-acetyltransferase [Terrimonas ginsenosidimutans]MCG2614221.1 GNAT family N-acetyltransferase [Terrimonas ginsenosidimutans]